MADDMRKALDERHELIDARADAVLAGALTDKAAWTAQLGPEPKDAKQRTAWRRAAIIVAAYRDRYQITDDRTPLGSAPPSTRQKIDAARARAAVAQAHAIATESTAAGQGRRTWVARTVPSL
jgi:hypothetical protein